MTTLKQAIADWEQSVVARETLGRQGPQDLSPEAWVRELTYRDSETFAAARRVEELTLTSDPRSQFDYGKEYAKVVAERFQ